MEKKDPQAVANIVHISRFPILLASFFPFFCYSPLDKTVRSGKTIADGRSENSIIFQRIQVTTVAVKLCKNTEILLGVFGLVIMV